MITLRHLQNTANIAEHDIAPSRTTRNNEAEVHNFDDIDPFDDEETPASSLMADTNTIPVEEQQVYLPCNGDLANVEIKLRRNQASRLLHQLQELIADKSFQYLHIIQEAPRKGVRTRAQADIQQLVNKIALHARMYNHCRSRLIALDCDADTSNMFQWLTKDDLNASTAILKPNVPGSTTLRLSWIWHNHIWTGVIASHMGNPMPTADTDVVPDAADAAADAIPAAADAHRFWECN
jgi:hypothetical protein